MNITYAKKTTDDDGNVESIKAIIDGMTIFIPVDPANRHYTAIMEQVDSGTLTIAEADNGE